MIDDNMRIADKQAMIDWVAAGETPKSDWKIGTEHEKLLYRCDTQEPIGYEGPNGVAQLLSDLLAELGSAATPILEKGKIIGLKDGEGGSVTLEPGGQLELSGAPLANLHQTCAETGRHLRHMRNVADPLCIGMLGVGYHPTAHREDISFMPKGRYKIMSAHMPKVGSLGLDMMLRSCTVQVNLDYGDEVDMRRKFRTSLALQPVATALFANSPFKEGQVSPSCRPAHMPGQIPTPPDAGFLPVCLMRLSAMNNGLTTFLMCRCILSIAARIISMSLDIPSAISWRVHLRTSKGRCQP